MKYFPVNKLCVEVQIGNCYNIKDINGRHYHIVVAESSEKETGMVMLVYLTSANMNGRWCDQTTIFTPGDEHFIDKKCWIKYQTITIRNKQELLRPEIDFLGKINQTNLERIQKGITVSEHVSRQNRELFVEWHHGHLLKHGR